MRSHTEIMLRVAVTLAILIGPVCSSGVYLPSRYFMRSSVGRRRESYPVSRSRRTITNCDDDNNISTAWMVARKQKSKSENPDQEEVKADNTGVRPAGPPERELTYADLGPIGKTVAGCTEIVITTALDFCSGYLQGLLFGTLVGTPGFVFRPVTKGVRQPFSQELAGRFARMNGRSTNWAKKFGGISAAFGGFGVAVKVIRNGEQDAWTDIFSSAAAGAYFGRNEGPQGMLRGALLYGGLIYVTSGSRRTPIQDYTEEPLASVF